MNQQEKSPPRPRVRGQRSPLARLSKGLKGGWQRSTLPARGINALKKVANALVLALIMVSVVVIDVVATLMHALCRLFGGRSMRDIGHHAP
ncbi:hypothetical protein CYR55_01245 [Chimaeribacter californicus]|uniref:Uncharacterized protein n=1 Tax=Chimaeribacter californicus TaxID=2060067 RepID=A0A2N5EG47_9GAMM|nr:hypothetical protein [Chimaeribacter californicus]PLR41489.1 hypothetical protein CYR55_01245 [Chimaeribacter californicus]